MKNGYFMVARLRALVPVDKALRQTDCRDLPGHVCSLRASVPNPQLLKNITRTGQRKVYRPNLPVRDTLLTGVRKLKGGPGDAA